MMIDKGRYSLVTGASGVIGSALCDRLVAQDVNVIAMTRQPCKLPGCRSWCFGR